MTASGHQPEAFTGGRVVNPRKLAWAYNWCRLNSCRGVAEWPYSAAALVRVDKRVHPSAGGAAGQLAAILWRRSDMGTRGWERRQATCQVVVLVVAAHGRSTDTRRYKSEIAFTSNETTSGGQKADVSVCVRNTVKV